MFVRGGTLCGLNDIGGDGAKRAHELEELPVGRLARSHDPGMDRVAGWPDEASCRFLGQAPLVKLPCKPIRKLHAPLPLTRGDSLAPNIY